MKTINVIILAFFFAFALNAQTQITGTVTDETGEVIIGANVSIKDTYDGASTDIEGKFDFSSDEKGTATLNITYISYENFEQTIELNGQPIELQVVLKAAASDLDMVVITAGAFEASDEKKAVVLKSIDIAMTAGATADIAGALNTLPGTTKVGEDGQLYVRGGAASETRTFIDGMVVQNPYGSSVPDLPARGRFSPFLFKGTMFSTGGYSAEYGQALSSALILNTQDLAPQRVTGISLMTVGGELSHTERWENTSLSLSGSYSNLKPYTSLVKQNIDWIKAPQDFGGQAIFRHKTSETGMIKLHTNASRSQLALEYPNMDDVNSTSAINLTNDNLYVNASYKEILNDKWTMFTGLAFTNNADLIKGEFEVDTKEQSAQAKVTFSNHLNDDVRIKFGVETLFNQFDEKYKAERSQVFETNLDEKYLGSFVETDVYFSKKLVARAGARLERSNLLDKWNLAPRLSLAYKTGEKSQISLAFGQFYQTPENEHLRYSTDVSFERADHLMANYQIIKNKRTLRVEAYYKQYENLIKFDQQTPWLSTNEGNGYAKGIDVFYRDQKSIKNGDFWVSYSYLDTERDYLDFPTSATPHFASKHNFAFVYKHWIPKITTSVGFTYSYGSGRPYNDPNLSTFNSERTKAYQDLSFNASHLTHLFGQFTVLYASVSNLPGFDNTFGYRYSNVPNDAGQFTANAVKPPAKRFFFVGMFISIGQNKN